MKIIEFYHNARRRAERRKSPWQFLLIIFGFCAWIAIWYRLFNLIWIIHVYIYPSHQFSEFWNGDESATSLLLSFLMMFALAPISMISGFMLSNILFWLIAPARKNFERNQGTLTYATSGLLKPLKWSLLGIIISIISANLLHSLK